jgi:signal transduction histidine kinase
MRERLRQLGGSLEIESNGKGTLVRAILKSAV